MADPITFHTLTATNADVLRGADVFDNPVDAIQLARFVAEDSHLMVFAMAGQRVIGFASGAILYHPDKAPAFFVNEVDVTPDHQRQGIATALCQRLFEAARTAGAQGIWLATEADNVPARALYRRLKARETTGNVVYDWDGAMDV